MSVQVAIGSAEGMRASEATGSIKLARCKPNTLLCRSSAVLLTVVGGRLRSGLARPLSCSDMQPPGPPSAEATSGCITFSMQCIRFSVRNQSYRVICTAYVRSWCNLRALFAARLITSRNSRRFASCPAATRRGFRHPNTCHAVLALYILDLASCIPQNPSGWFGEACCCLASGLHNSLAVD